MDCASFCSKMVLHILKQCKCTLHPGHGIYISKVTFFNKEKTRTQLVTVTNNCLIRLERTLVENIREY